MPVILSICVPTYNRSEYLIECLQSILISVTRVKHYVEIIISDNASTDDTEEVIRALRKTHPWIRYHRNEQNIGAERNFYLLATLARGDNIWIFGDDDKMEPNAVPRVLENIHTGYNLTICNYSLWDKQFAVQVKNSAFSLELPRIFDDANDLMECYGLHLGYLSAVVINRALFLKLPFEEYEPYAEYGFSFMLAIYNGVANGNCKAGFIAEQLVCNRGGNSGGFDWYKYFVTGSSLVFDKLLLTGYSKKAIMTSKHNVLKDFVIPHVFGTRTQEKVSQNLNNLLFRHYKSNWLFWGVCVPLLFLPPSLLHFAKKTRQIMHKFRGIKP